MPPPAAADASSPPPLVHAIGGSIGGALATLAFYPLEILRVEAQKSRARGATKHDASDGDGGGGGTCRSGSNEEDGPRKSGRSNSAASPDRPETDLECLVRLFQERALYRGASAMVTTMIASSFITFYALEATRRSLTNLQRHGGGSLRGKRQQQLVRLRNHAKFLAYLLPKSKSGMSLLASSLAGVINVFLTTPLWVGTRRIMESSSEEPPIRTSQKGPQRQPNLWNVMHQISRDEGVIRLWQGTWSSLLLVSNPAIQYFLYERIRAFVLGRRNRDYRRRIRHGKGGGDGGAPSATLTAAEALVFGAIAKTISTVVTYPLQLAQVLIRLRSNEVKSNETLATTSEPTTEQHNKAEDRKLREFDGIADCLRQQLANGGFRSLFHGMNSKLLQTVLTAAFTFLTYEETLGIVGRVYQSSFAR